MSDAQKLIADAHYAHEWRGECLGCRCGWNWPEERTYFCGEEDRISKAHSEHVAAEIDKALGALKPEYIARHESGGGTIHGTLVNAEIAMRSYVVFPPGVDEPGSGRLTGIETRWVSGWSEVQS
ncbi:hypothetical protein [Mycolicibacterium conceptionense]|uniref:hypothetical protein n=1 Tax=Mycolicibacterium conceptionense TaxID=451644 RepID=UPI0007ED54FB|nr:hypothetical protein [Mycolicibacterium conceptionense]OBK09036.1 hypothetical protein A5639_11940 [Mycolicibacterium conceptionense]